jgi:hypothetical protein
MPCSKLLQNLVFVFRSHPCKITKRCKPFQTLRSKYDFKAFKSKVASSSALFSSSVSMNAKRHPLIDSGLIGASPSQQICSWRFSVRCSSCAPLFHSMNDKDWSDWLSLVAFSVHLGTSKCSSTTEVQINLVMFSGLACFFFFAQFVAASIRCAQCCLIFRESNHNLPHGRTCLLGQLPPVDGHFCTNMHKHYFILFFQYPIRLFFLFRFGHRLLSKKFSRL